MPRVILLTDFGEQYSNHLLRGIVRYARGNGTWVLCKMPLSYRDMHGVGGVLRWALNWKADGIIGQFRPTDDVALFRKYGIAAIAQDYIQRFADIPNITGAHLQAGQMGADYLIKKGFKNFGFYGLPGVIWSDERCEGFVGELLGRGYAHNFWEYSTPSDQEPWFYHSAPLEKWLRGLPTPVAIMACDDAHAQHIVEAANNCGIRVPEQVAVLGVDNDENICTVSDPPISSMEQDTERGGYEAASLMARMIFSLADGGRSGEHFEDVIVNPVHVVTRRSTELYASDDYYISLALRHIHENSDRRMSVDDIVELVPLSRRLLERRFLEATGFSVYSYIQNVRIEKFAKRLVETNDSIVDIALGLGFSDDKNISRQFKRIKGCTPSEFRRRNTK